MFFGLSGKLGLSIVSTATELPLSQAQRGVRTTVLSKMVDDISITLGIKTWCIKYTMTLGLANKPTSLFIKLKNQIFKWLLIEIN